MRNELKAAIALGLGVAIVVPATADATCIENDDGSVTCCAGSAESCSTTMPSNAPLTFKRLERQKSLVAGIHGVSNDDTVGAGVHVGWRLRRVPSKGTLGEGRAGYGALCAPVLCGGVGFEDVPSSALVGDEIGVDVAIDRGTNRSLTMVVRPVARASTPGRLRTASLLGAALPEVSISLRGERTVALHWNPFPIEYKLTRRSQLVALAGVGATIYDGSGEASGLRWKAQLGWTVDL